MIKSQLNCLLSLRKIYDTKLLSPILFECYQIVRNVSSKNYDKKIHLKPIDIEYRYDDKQFLRGPSMADEPYIRPTDDEIVEFKRLKMEKEVARETRIYCDPDSEPFRQVYSDNDDGYNMFTKTEPIADPDGSIWKWVERLMPKQTLGPLREGSEIIKPPKSLSESSNKLPYHIRRTRSRLYPIYLDYLVIDRDHKHYWRNRWDHMFNKYNAHILDRLDEIKWENNEKTIEVTKITQVQGDIWQFEEDCRLFLQNFYDMKEPIMTSVNEVRGVVNFKGNFIDGATEFFKQKGF